MPGLPTLRSGLRLRTFIFIASALVLGATLLVLGVVMGHITQQSIEKEEGNKLAAESKYFAELLDLTIGQQLTDLRSRAALLAQLGLHVNPKQLAPWLSAIQQDFSDYTWIGFADPDGRVVSSTANLLKGKSVQAREWFIRGKSQPITVDLHPALLLEPFLSSRADGPWRFIDLASPVHDAHGRLLGVLGAHLSWDWLIRHHQRFSDSLSRNRHADIVVVGVDGLARLTSPTARMHALGGLESFQRAASGESGWIHEQWPDGQHFLVGYTRNPGYGEHHQLGWVTLIRLPQEHIIGLASPAIWTIAIAVITANLVLLAAVILLVKLAIKPIETFASETQHVAKAGGRMPIRPQMSKELQLLAQATNDMVDALEARKASEQAKMRFIADGSHEIRNPMQGAMGYARLIQGRASTAQDQHDSEQLIRCILAATDVSNDILDISAHEAGKLKLVPRPCRIRELIESSVAIVAPQASEKGLALTHDIDLPDGLVVMADEKRLRQVMLNLLNNAIKFTAKGGIALHAASMAPSHSPLGRPPEAAISGRRAKVSIAVSDTGIGMSRHDSQAVLGRWQQATHDASAAPIGFGLGLDITMAIIHAMGGTMEVSSAPEQGTQIRMQFDFELADDPPKPAASTPAAHGISAGKQTLKVLVVDDIDMNREVLRRWLQIHGHDVAEASTGTLALAKAQDTGFDVILMDIDLPDIDGRKAAAAIRSPGSASQHAWICALSGHGFADDVQASIQAGMDQHLVKPLDLDALQTLMDEAYRRAGRNT
jgi:signal transduction histidine kinase/ActR/RegA family two-component response regulator